jgi:cysteinyl-tRNA synthetase
VFFKFDPMELKLYDTLTREKRLFKPIDPNNVRMYVCGPTVYDFAHIGNARPLIVFDVLFRLLRRLAKQGVWDGGEGETKVTYVRNITDVDDKINARAAEEYPDLPLNDAIRKVTEKTETQFHEDVAALGCLPPTVEPRATEHIAEMRELIEKLVASGNAYVAEDNVLFSVPSMKDYGQLSKRPLDEMIAGARVEVAPYKRDSRDFVLWKPSKPGEPAWPSPAGIKAPGRPGWHIECSAMSWRYLGEMFDIHGGGIDLVFPHHEDEIAQSRCAFHTPVMANYWMHNGFLQVEGEKMSKSEGNFVTIHELLKTTKFGGRRWVGEVLKLAMLMTHYRQPIDFSSERLGEARNKINVWSNLVLNLSLQDFRRPPSAELVEILSDDLNTPEAISYLSRQESKAHQSLDAAAQFAADTCFVGVAPFDFMQRSCDLSDADLENLDREITRLLGQAIEVMDQLLEGEAIRTLAALEQGIGRAEIDTLIEDRKAARKARDFTESDRIRDELAKMGVVLKDTKDGTTWEIAR